MLSTSCFQALEKSDDSSYPWAWLRDPVNETICWPYCLSYFATKWTEIILHRTWERKWKVFLLSLIYLPTIFWVYVVCPEGIHPRTMKKRDIYWRRYKIQEILYIRQWCLSPLQSGHLGTPHSSPNCPMNCPIISHWWSEISSLSRVTLVLGKARSRRVPNLCCGGAEPSG